MVQQSSVSEIFYPDRDGQPMADNTAQFQWIVTIKENLELLYADDPNIFVAGDLLSPRLQIRFGVTPETWEIYRPDGSRFLTFVELGQRLATTSQQLDETSQRLETSETRAARLAEQLRDLGVDPAEA